MSQNLSDFPAEILAMIFEEGKKMTDAMHFDGDESHQGTTFEILVSHVCSYFRQVSLITPALWTSIHAYGSCKIDEIVERLERSNPCELDIRIESATHDPQIIISKMDKIVDLILAHSLRWRSLFLRYMYERQEHPVVMRLCSVPAPMLRLLSITVDDVDRADIMLINRAVGLPHIFNTDVPLLQFVRLRGLATQLFRPPLTTIVTLHLDQIRYLPVHFSTLREILTASPHLANLSIHGDILDPGSWPHQLNAIHLPNLRSLRLYSESGEAYSGIMEGFYAPKLESLTLKSLQEHDLDSLWDIADQGPKFHNLATLNFIDFDFNSITYKRMFQTFQNITTFSVLCVPVGHSPLMKILAEGKIAGPNGSPYTPWPKLKTLVFAADIWGDDDIINIVVDARTGCGCPISTFVFAIGENDNAAQHVLTLEYQGRNDIEIKFCPENLEWPETRAWLDHEDSLF